jgi:carboxyl-terminal processing protease
MRGRAKEPVTLTVLHPGDDKPVDIEIVRDVIQVASVLGDTRNADGSWDYFLEGRDRIGYVRINVFGRDTVEELQNVLRRLVEQGMRGLVLDLRNNAGGRLDAAIDICDLLIPSGEIVTMRGRHGRILRAYQATGNAPFTDFPLAVLVNQVTASASEIVAACLQDHGRAVVVGQRTYGKGTVQEIIDLRPSQGELKLTTASYWRPTGRNIHREQNAGDSDAWGVRPDPGYEVPPAKAEPGRPPLVRRDLRKLPAGQPHEGSEAKGAFPDPQLDRAVEYLEEAIRSRQGPATP